MNHLFQNKKMKRIIVTSIAIIILIAGGIGFLSKKDAALSVSSDSKVKEVVDTDLVIQVKDVSEKATFYPVKVEGTKMEVIVVKASDGSVRTAFNTCQVCNNSGKGYYKQDGNQLVCQNCGNRFGMDDVEVTRGGCNPVPLSEEYKTINTDTITVSKDILKQAAVLFERWK